MVNSFVGKIKTLIKNQFEPKQETLLKILLIIHNIQWSLPIADIPNSRNALNSGQNVKSQMWRSFLNYLPIANTSSLRHVGVCSSEVSLYTGIFRKGVIAEWFF